MLAFSAEICQKQRAGEGVRSTLPALTTRSLEDRMANDVDSAAERWLPVPGYEGRYEVSDHGRVRSLARIITRTMADGSIQHQNRPEKIMGQATCGGSTYPRVSLTVDYEKKTFTVHSLVLRAFVGRSPEGMECRHLDGNYLNARLDNLQWGTHPENETDKLQHGSIVRGEEIPQSVLTSSDVLAIRRRYAAGELQYVMAREFGVSKATICRAINGNCWAHVP